MVLLLAVLAGSLVSQTPAASAQTSSAQRPPVVLHMGPHPYPSSVWDAAYVHHCLGRDVGFAIKVEGQRVRITNLDLGAASTPDNIGRLNDALAKLQFLEVSVTCTPGGAATLLFNGQVDTGGATFDPAHVTVDSPGASSEQFTIEQSAEMAKAL